MRGLVIILCIALVGVGVWLIITLPKAKSTKQKTAAINKYSVQFNQSVNEAMESYYSLTDAFVQWDSLAVNKQASLLKTRLDSLDLNEVKKDSAIVAEKAQAFITNAKNDLQSMQQAVSLIGKRHSLDTLSKDVFNLLRVLQYHQSKLYLQECPMAFNDEDTGVWVSKSPEIRNPYMGLHHPTYGHGMIGCGETRDTLNFTDAK